MNIKLRRICILGGGWSNEREISLKSSNDVFKCLKEHGHDVVHYDMQTDCEQDLKNYLQRNSIDIVFNLIHGEGGEDGKLQSYLDRIGVDYTGSNALASHKSFNKNLTKKIWIENGLNTPKHEIYNGQGYSDLFSKFGSAFFIKDTCSGSSKDIFLIKKGDEYKSFIEYASADREYIIEEKINADEYTGALIQNTLLPIIKIIPSNTYYDYDSKYKSDATQFIFPELGLSLIEKIKSTIIKANNSIGCETWSRVDFFLDKKEIILLEINTIPGMTDHSLVPKAAKKFGLSYYDLIIKILNNA